MLEPAFKNYSHLKNDFWQTIYNLQNNRLLWLIGAIFTLILQLIAIFFFQSYLNLAPCEKCVYIRLSITVICMGMIFVFISPRTKTIKLIAYLLIVWAIVQGMLWSIELNNITKEMENSTLNYCSLVLVHFPFDLPLDDWFPYIFKPTGLCGEDTWKLFGLNMAQYMIFIYFVYFIILSLFLLAIVLKIIRVILLNN